MTTQNINLNSLTAAQGISITGIANSETGWSVNSVGDLNGDGYADIIIGSPDASDDAGISYVIYGDMALGNIDLASLTSSQGFTISGATGSYSGYSVASAGDINKDGFVDIIIGAPGTSTSIGISYVIYGGISLGNIDLASMASSQGFSISGAIGSGSGYSVASAGDINKDGFPDIIIGAPFTKPCTGEGYCAGASYIIYGNFSLPNSINLATLTTVQGFSINGTTDSLCGNSVAGIGDINNDGYDDVIIGAPSTNLGAGGVSYIIYGNSSFPSSINLATLISVQGFSITGIEGSYTGWSVSSAGDVNGDGFTDIIIGAPGASNDAGSSYVIYGGMALNNIDLASLTSSQGFSISGTVGSSGYSVASAGDVNKDGFADIIIGAPSCPPGALSCSASYPYGIYSYVVYGNTSFNSSINLANLDTLGFSTTYTTYSSHGISVASAGDINNDGYADIIIGIPVASESYVIYGAASGYVTFSPTSAPISKPPTAAPTQKPTKYMPTVVPTEIFVPLPNINLATLNSNQGFSIMGINYGDETGTSVSWAGDVNGDGYKDILIGAPGANSGTGTTFLIYGQKTFASTIDLASLGSQGITIFGANEGDYSGSSVGGAGDVNGDGYGDIIIGAPSANSQNGEVYIVYGGASLPSTINLASLGNRGFTVIGTYSNGYSSYTGTSVSSAGDVNGDGYDDIVIGAPGNECCYGTTSSYIIYGGFSLPVVIFLSSLGSSGVVIYEDNINNIGYSVRGLGDINNDRYDDIIISCPGSAINYIIYGSMQMPSAINVAYLGSSEYPGITLTYASNSENSASLSSAGDFNNDGYNDVLIGTGPNWIVFGDNSLPSTINLGDIQQPYGINIEGSCTSVSGIGDINRDGYDDVMLGATSSNYPYGAVYILYGKKSLPSTIQLSTMPLELGFNISTTNPSQTGIGYSVSGLGDINNDGFSDIILGIPSENTQTGAAYVIFGSDGIIPSSAPTTAPADVNSGDSTETADTDVGLISGLSICGAALLGVAGYAFYAYTHHMWPFAIESLASKAAEIESSNL